MRAERRTVVVFCEGEGSEPDYVNGLKQLPGIRARTSVDLRIDPRHGVPLTLVEHAVDTLRDDEVDECWCLFAHIATEDAERRSRHLEGREGKRIDPSRYLEHRAVAGTRAEALARRHASGGTPFPEDNPSSSMGAFVRAVEGS